MKKIFILLILLISLSSSAQYADEIQFASISYNLMQNILFSRMYSHNHDVLKSRFVKEVKMRNENSTNISATYIDKMGRPEKFIEYSYTNAQARMINANYDAKGNLITITDSDVKSQTNSLINFNFVGNTLIDIDKSVNGERYSSCRMRYDAEDKTKLTGYDATYWEENSIPYYVNFKYDEQNRLYDVRVLQDTGAIYSIKYSGDTVTYYSEGGSETFVIKNDVLIKHKIHSEALSLRAERTFHYDDNGLIDYIIYEDSKFGKYKYFFDYIYYH